MRAAALLLCVCFLAGCGGGESVNAPPNAALSLEADRWEFFYSDGVGKHPTAEPVGWSFDFPQRDGAHYLLTEYGQDMSRKLSVTIAGRIDEATGTVWEFPGKVGSGSGQALPSTGIMIQRRGDDMVSGYGRWWASARVTMRVGAFSVAVPLNPAYWSSVYGERGDASANATEGFRNALANAGNIGLTFGGGGAYGHGVWVGAGAAKFTLVEFSIN